MPAAKKMLKEFKNLNNTIKCDLTQRDWLFDPQPATSKIETDFIVSSVKKTVLAHFFAYPTTGASPTVSH
jgi:hypothetical protein